MSSSQHEMRTTQNNDLIRQLNTGQIHSYSQNTVKP